MGFGVLGLMVFIDHANGLRQAFGTQEENMHTDFLHQNQSNVHIDPQLLCSWVVMNRGQSHESGPRGVTTVHVAGGRGTPANVARAECSQT